MIHALKKTFTFKPKFQKKNFSKPFNLRHNNTKFANFKSQKPFRSNFTAPPNEVIGTFSGAAFARKNQFRTNWKSFNQTNNKDQSLVFKSFRKFNSWKNPYWKKIPSIDKRFNICLWVRETYNNIFLTVTDNRGCVRASISGGFSKLRGNNRSSYRSVEIITRILLKKLNRIRIHRVPFKTLCVFLVTPKNGVISSLLELISGAPKLHMISSRIRIPHNGIRLKKLRRL
jgi:ribosomal protein S11